jgi:acyl-coenzyme A synthetase/AMP-(fatty) acid ligase
MDARSITPSVTLTIRIPLTRARICFRRTAELRKRLAIQLDEELAPKAAKFVSDLPKAKSTKLIRRLVKAVYLGESLGDTSALENPGALEALQAAHA